MRRRVVAAVLAVCGAALIPAGCADGSVEYQRTIVDGQNVLGVVREGRPIQGVVVFFHGLDRDESILELDAPHRRLSATLADAGYAVVSSYAGGNAFGSAASQRNYEQLAYGAADHYRTPRVFFLAESMGAVSAINIMAKSPELPVVGLAAINPLLNTDALTADYHAQAAAVNPDLPGSNPLGLPVNALGGRNFRFYIANADDVVLTSENAVPFERRFGPVANVSVVQCQGGHMDPSCIQGEDIVAWFSSLNRQ